MAATVLDIVNWIRQTAPQAELASDSRALRQGDVFLAYPGDETDGRNYIEHALARGAAAVIHETRDFDWNADWKLPRLGVDNLKEQAGFIASQYYGEPDRTMTTIAVTGTNGKTSCTQWLGRLLSRLGQQTAVIGTLGVGMFRNGSAGEFTPNGYTTPDAILLQRTLAALQKDGARALAIEASSIGLHQKRMAGMHVDIAVFTNFTRDHLDYHGDMAAYEEAKAMLFGWPGLRHAVINLDDAMGLRLIERMRRTQPKVNIIGYTLTGASVDGVDTLQASDIRSTQLGTSFHLTHRLGNMLVKSQVVGHFNVSNLLAVIGVLLAQGVKWSKAIDAIEALTPVPGRMQQLGGSEAPLVVIDYAHTPDALEKVLASLRGVANERSGELWCIFGCGGDRDSGKRPQMGKAAAAADRIIVTTDNPRSEDPAAIIRQIVPGFERTGKQPQIIEDRATAILWAVQHATRHDVILVAGKGHEAFQEVKGRKLPFLDADHAALALSARAMKGVS
ncbi:MAG TPA: UDP-N-acetylmuramoyl-L-alanyl-D-glutamate--2,6-diaminopimelate ligase [Oxalicibacterium sp.]|jgi:UDP-N-acetylmuramoyl-L-alanyl-D-glutamate--2,6-diaminopimelate ligase|nr:UDP-N-acetylmuramoyl-L-alanyl-D-glutamate--2,6-diaminopimelate ligase [Oxalicibacterium sp.]